MPSTAEPIAAPMISWAIVPTTISDNAVEMRNQIESRLAISARPSHSAAKRPNASHPQTSKFVQLILAQMFAPVLPDRRSQTRQACRRLGRRELETNSC